VDLANTTHRTIATDPTGALPAQVIK